MMSLAEQADGRSGLIANHREQAQHIAAEYTEIEGFEFGRCGVVATEGHLAAGFAREPELRLNQN